MPTTSILYALAGTAIVYLFQQRRQQLSRINKEMFPEFSEEQYQQLITLLKTAYERTLYLGVLFFPLAWAARPDGATVTQYFFLSLIALLFLSNIIPRNKIMKLLAAHDLKPKDLRERGIVL